MKPHLPISLLASLLGVLLSTSAHAAYTTPTTITTPEGYKVIRVDNEALLQAYSAEQEPIAFRLKEDLAFNSLSDTLVSKSAGDRYFTSNAINPLASVTFNYASGRLFDSSSELEFCFFLNILFNENESDSNYAVVKGNDIKYNNNHYIEFKKNSAENWGGAIYSASRLYFQGNGKIIFDGNSIESNSTPQRGGAIYSVNLSINENDYVEFRNNSVCQEGVGGAIYSERVLSITENNGVSFIGNNIQGGNGGAIAFAVGNLFSSAPKVEVNLSGNNKLLFSSNSATYGGGAVWVPGKGSILWMKNNDSLTIENNNAHYSTSYSNADTYGGAIRTAGEVLVGIENNGLVIITGNTVSSEAKQTVVAHGGAIYLGEDSTLAIRNNSSVLFEKNAEIANGIYQLRSIYGEDEIKLFLSAGAGKKIEFRDAVRLGAGSVVNINSSYVDADDKLYAQTGTVLLTGAYTAQHIREVKGKDATSAEIDMSRRVDMNGRITLNGGVLRLEEGIILQGTQYVAAEKSASTTVLQNSSMEIEGNVIFSSGTTLSGQGKNELVGALDFKSGSNLQFYVGKENTSAAVLTHSGSITMGGTLKVKLDIADGLRSGDYLLFNTDSGEPSNWTSQNVSVSGLSGWDVSYNDLYWSGNTLYLKYESDAVWDNGSGNRQWNIVSYNWDRDGNNSIYQNGKRVRFENTGSGTVSLVGTLTPKSVTVNNGSGYDYTWQGSGKLAGSMKLTKKGAGTLTIKTSNSYTGGTAISGGTVVLGANNALGSGAITLSNATLNMGGKITPNNLTLSGSSKILSGTNYRGNFTMNGNLLAGSSINIISGKTATLKKGNVGGTISGAGNTVINGAVTLNGGKIATNKLTISGSGKKLTANASGLVMNKNASDITLSASGNLTSAGAITARNITLSNKAVLNAKNSAVRNITLGGKLQATDSTVNMFGNLTAGNLVLTRSTLTNNGSSVRNLGLSGALTLSSATLNHYGNISAKNVTATASGIRQTGGSTGMKLSGNLSLGSKSTLNLFGTLNAANVTLSGNSVLNNANSTVRNAVVKGKLQATNSTVNLHGNLTAGNVVLNNATLRDNGSSARAVTVTNSTSLSNNAKLNIKGYLRSKNLTLSKSSLRQHSNNNGVALTGTLTMNSGSTLTAQGALSAANMKLSGGTINLTSASFSTIKVSGTLTLSSAIDLNLGCKLTTGKNYTLIRFNKTNLTSRNNLAKLLGLTGSGATLTLRSTGITLKVTNAAAWNKYLSANKTAFNKAASVVNAIAPAAEESEVVEIAADTATTVAAEPAYDRSSADMLVQSNRGVVNASRAFTDTLGNRASNSTAFGADKSSAVWLSAMGASSRLSSDGAAAGSDYNLFGAAVGMEQQLTEKSSLGLAIGESYGRVNCFTSARTQQDTLHTALYGQYSAVERSRDAVLLDWSAAYGRTESKWQGTEWEQKSVQLDARATWAHQLTADTTVSGFAGMQYFASESADIAPGIKSGSVQNLRGELGVGVGHKLTGKTRLFSELSFVGDMVRHNPTADMGGVRERGANSGRAGINFSVGGTHAINDKWSVNASYNLELMERANSHSANIGTSYKF